MIVFFQIIFLVFFLFIIILVSIIDSIVFFFRKRINAYREYKNILADRDHMRKYHYGSGYDHEYYLQLLRDIGKK